ncbi:MAG: zinc ribbon domain-containing protein [Prevotella sp.]|nr:zinc ribbon domain-containing protein [Prevotella sp.]
MKTCPNCGAQIMGDYRFCIECGSKIPQGNSCPHCGAQMSVGDIYCQKCGKRANDAANAAEADSVVNLCPHCGSPMNEGDTFCQNCGRGRLDSGQASTPIYNTQQPIPNNQRPSLNTTRQGPKGGSRNNMIIPMVIVAGILLLALLVGSGWWYYNSSKSKKAANVITGINVTNNKSGIEIVGIGDDNPAVVNDIENEGSDYEGMEDNSSSNSKSRVFSDEQDVVGNLANQTFSSSDGFTIRFDGNGRMYSGGNYAGVISVLSHNSRNALLRYSGGVYDEGKLSVQIVGDKLQLTDPVDGTTFFQR